MGTLGSTQIQIKHGRAVHIVASILFCFTLLARERALGHYLGHSLVGRGHILNLVVLIMDLTCYFSLQSGGGT